MSTISPIHGNVNRGSSPVTSESIRVFLSNISDKNILENIFKRSVSSINSLEKALLDERHRTEKLLYEKRHLEILLAKNHRRRKTHQLRQGAVRVAQKVVNATEYYATSLSNAAATSLDNLTQSNAWSIISGWEKSSDESRHDINNEKKLVNSNTEIQKDPIVDIKQNFIKPSHGYGISNKPYTEVQINCSTGTSPIEIIEKLDRERPHLKHINESETSQNKAIVIMDVTFKLESPEYKL
ncbi:uncharacterized protein LOC128883243 isoform X2 [Hylaeus volcanicus]|uniref:uncharacterized protein LOC128883243 isoform X2 n=1 Tax=Hylaeus volcanicus TaxID=313075 RepID=UPI0023B83014|nr:uncharacterized protein LOC128883243 isoform X2 [Hylaeus volcanicus]